MVDVVIHSRPTLFRSTMDKYVNKICFCISTVRAEQFRYQVIKRSWGIEKPLGHNQPPQNHTAWSTNRCKRDITCSHEKLITTIDKVECTVHCRSCHVVLNNVLFRNGCLCWYIGRIKLIINMHNTPIPIIVFDTNVGAE